MSVFGKDVDAATAKMGGEWVKASEFEGGLTLKFKSVEKVKSQYGAEAKDGIVEKGILDEGATFRYVFEDSEGNTRKHDSSSFPLFIGMQQAEINENDWLAIKREGQKDKTRYTVEVVEGPKVSQRKNTSKDDVEESSPF